jgi:thymidylate kinase
MTTDVGKFVIVEGLTGSGKSTTAKALAERLRGTYLDPVDDIFSVPRRAIESDADQLAARHALFLAAILYSSSIIKRIRVTGKSVVVDSWIYRTNATHMALGSKLEVNIPTGLEIETCSFFLDCPESIRLSRKAKRGQPDGYWKASCEGKSREIIENYKLLSPSTVFLDANRSTTAIVDSIMGHL